MNPLELQTEYLRYSYTEDNHRYVRDYWQTPEEFKASGCGDCEDFAIAKFFDLYNSGYKPWLVYCFCRSYGHMVVAVDSYILDVYSTLPRDNPVGLTSIYGFNCSEYRIFTRFQPGVTDLGVHRLSKWVELLGRIKNGD